MNPKQLNPNSVDTRERLVLGHVALYSIAEIEALIKQRDEALAESSRAWGRNYSLEAVNAMIAGRAEASERAAKELGEQLEFDRTLVAECVTKAEFAVNGRHWLTEGRGCYEWDDDRWHDEFKAAAIEILRALEPMTKVAANWAGCPRDSDGVAKARIDWKVRAEAAERERDEALAKLNTPELHDFRAAVVLEAAHQRERWGSEHDAGKTPTDWFWLLGYLSGKALAAHSSGDIAKTLHHTISSAACLANWHAAVLGQAPVC